MQAPTHAAVPSPSPGIRVHALLDPESGDRAGGSVRWLTVAAVVLYVASIVLGTVRTLHDAHATLFAGVEQAALVLFAIDYAARVWSAPADPALAARGSFRARLAYATSALGVIDLLAVVPLAIDAAGVPASDWTRALALVAVLKITRYAPALQLFVAVIRNESRVLLSALLAMAVNWILVSAIVYALEHPAQPDVFSSLPQAMWWAIVTMATVGYGDIVPVTPAGRVFGGLVMVLGIASVAVPAGILATGFSAELHKQRSMISWKLVAKLPLFAHLEAARIAAIARLLKLDVVPPRYTIVMRGEPGDAMFFIVSGQVEVQLEPQPLRLGPGQYFGEIALLREVPRTATIVSVTECELLVLAAADFRRLLQEYPSMAESIRAVADRRVQERPAA